MASLIGPVKDPIGRPRDGSSLRYGEERQIVDAGFVLTDELRAELGELSFVGSMPSVRDSFATFHTDDSFVECPAAATVLHAGGVAIVHRGGATCFLDMPCHLQTRWSSTKPAAISRLGSRGDSGAT